MRNILSFTGAAGVGKTSIVRALLPEGFKPIPSITTRPLRESDIPGEIINISQEEFQKLIVQDDFAWHVNVHGNRYGTLKQSLDAARESTGYSTIIVVPDVVATLNRITQGQALNFYIQSPKESILRERLLKRGEGDLERRLRECKKWDEQARNSDTPYLFITNEATIEDAVAQIKSYL